MPQAVKKYKTKGQLNAEIHQRRWHEEVAAATRDIGNDQAGFPPIQYGKINWKKRTACRKSLKLFCETYMQSVFNMAWSPDHIELINSLEKVIRQGGRKAIAMPRGSGKTALTRAAALWAALNGMHRFIFLLGSKHNKAVQSLSSIKLHCTENRILYRDFPELHSFICLDGSPLRCRSQTCHGERTFVLWSADQIRFGCMFIPQEHLKRWPKNQRFYSKEKKAWMAPSSGVIIRTAGIDSAIRGEAETHPVTMEVMRPTVVLADDLQKDQAAESPKQVADLVSLIDGSVAGLAPPQTPVSMMFPCTVIKEDDASERFLDRTAKPEYLGQRCSMVTKWPAGITDLDMDDSTDAGRLWIKYSETRDHSLRTKGDISLATAFYKKNRAAMDAGCEVSWKERFYGDRQYGGNRELSAIQHAFNLRLSNPYTFAAEYQNRPQGTPDAEQTVVMLTPKELAKKTVDNNAQGIIPGSCHHLVSYIDVSDEMLWYVTAAAESDFTTYIVDYGTFPDYSSRRYIQKSVAQRWKGLSREFFRAHPNQTKAEKAPFEAKIYWSVTHLVGELMSRQYPALSGGVMSHTKIGVDCRWGDSTDRVKQAIRDMGDSRAVACAGMYVGATSIPFEEYQRKKGWMWETNMHRTCKMSKWILKLDANGQRVLNLDANALKSFVHNRFIQARGSKGGITLFDGIPGRHEMYADHLCKSETPTLVTARGRDVVEWTAARNKPDNDFLDCTCGCMALLSYSGANLTSGKQSAAPRKKVRTWAKRRAKRTRT